MHTIRGLILAIAALLVLRYVLSQGIRRIVTTATTDYSAKCLTMLGHTTSVQDGSTYIIGTFKNNCDRKFSHVTVAFMLDWSPPPDFSQMWSPSRPGASRNRAPQAPLDLPPVPIFAYSRDIQPHETRQFKSAHPISENATFHFDRITGY